MPNTPLYRLFFLLAFLGIAAGVCAQKKIDFNSKYLFTTEELGPEIKVLTDSVVFKHENATMFCDSALLNYGENYFHAYGNIKIVNPGKDLSDTVFLYGDSLHYYGDRKYAKVRNQVLLSKDSLQLFTDSLDYDLSENVGYYFDDGLTINGKDSLRSELGYYYADEDLLYFKKDIVIVNPQFTMYSDTLKHHTKEKVSYFLGPTHIHSDENHIYCENGWYSHLENIAQFNQNAYLENKKQSLKGDSIYYNKGLHLGKAFENVVFRDSAQQVLLKGERGLYNEMTGYAEMTERAQFIQVAEENDSLFLHADTLCSSMDSVALMKDSVTVKSFRRFRIVRAFHRVKSFKSDFQSVCDSMVYSQKDSVLRLFYNPIVWNDSNQLSGDFIRVRLENNEVRDMELDGKAFIIFRSDSIRFNQVFGSKMKGFVEKRELVQLNVMEKSTLIYFLKDELKRLIGMNKTLCRFMEIFFKEGKIDRIWFFEEPKGEITPPEDLSEDQMKLPDFHWEVKNRPRCKEDIFTWADDVAEESPEVNAKEKKEDSKGKEEKPKEKKEDSKAGKEKPKEKERRSKPRKSRSKEKKSRLKARK